ncbi:Hypothetical protein A7982_11268 [Minicystis rosea]|nr:Hypothetical protein A7982_11268 [Minicystis rosea]
MEQVTHCDSYEDARNQALAWMETWGGPIGAYYEVEIGRLGLATGLEVGVRSTIDPFRRIRLDFDPVKGPHFNAEVGKGGSRMKHAFTFPGTEDTIASHLRRRQPRG